MAEVECIDVDSADDEPEQANFASVPSTSRAPFTSFAPPAQQNSAAGHSSSRKICNGQQIRTMPKKNYLKLHSVAYDDADVSVVAIIPSKRLPQDDKETEQSPFQEPAPKGDFFHVTCSFSMETYEELLDVFDPFRKKYHRAKNQSHTCVQASCKPNVLMVPKEKLRGLPSFYIPMWHGFLRADTHSYIAPCGKILSDLAAVDDYLIFWQIDLDLDHFYFDDFKTTSTEILFTPVQCYYYLPDLSAGVECQPIGVINSVDRSVLSLDNFTYTKNYVIDHNALNTNNDGGFVCGCSCEDNCRSDTCSCKMLTEQGMSVLPEEQRHKYQHKRLFASSGLAIYECNSLCPCNSRCPNRVASNPMKVQVEIFKTARKGWGVRAKQAIPAGIFICIYAGEVFLDTVADARKEDEYYANLDYMKCAEKMKEGYEANAILDREDYASLNQAPSNANLATSSAEPNELNGKHSSSNTERPQRRSKDKAMRLLSELTSPSKPRRRRPKYLLSLKPFVLDGRQKGNVGRFLNHSCDPNCFVQNVFIDTHDPRLPTVCLFAKRHIQYMEELTWDYGYEVGSVPEREIQCTCGAANCRGRLL